MKLKVHLRDTVTGETRVYDDDYEREPSEEMPPYIWEEGNFSCDHNRHLFWLDAGGGGRVDTELPEGAEVPFNHEDWADQCCMGPGFTPRFVVDKYVSDDGREWPGDGVQR